MNLREFYLQRLKAEGPYFVRMLQALPADRLDYKPHERSQSAQEIAWLLAMEMRTCVDTAKDFKAEWKITPAPAMSEIIRTLEASAEQLSAEVERMDDATWDRKAQFYYQGKLVLEQPVGQFLWYILFDAIHHRGQLTTYVRPMGGKVPAIYGPSADEQGGMM